MKQTSSVCAVVVTYNRLNCLKTCIQRLQAQSYPCDLLVVDNASTDGTREWCFQHASEIAYLNTGENLGGAGGFNRGIRFACESGWEYLWLMDDDCWPEAKALEILLETGKSSSFGWLSSQCLWTDGTMCRMNLQRKSPFRDLHHFQEQLVPSKMASFVSLLLPSHVVRVVGLPISDFFIWGDDWEYTRRISRKLPCYVVPESRAIHAMKRNTVVSIAEDSQERVSRYFYSYRNDVYIYRREGILGWTWLLAKDIWHSVKAIRMGHPERISTIWKGFKAGLSFHPAVEMVHGGEMINERR